eukprot:580393-Pyramimonas_sp.AAC.1
MLLRWDFPLRRDDGSGVRIHPECSKRNSARTRRGPTRASRARRKNGVARAAGKARSVGIS